MASKIKHQKTILTGWFTTLKLLIPVALFSFFSTGLRAQLCPGSGPIFIDGNPADWPAVLNSAAFTQKGFRHDVNGRNFGDSHKDDGFTQGTSNNQPVEDWRWVFGNTNDKGDIENAGAVKIGNLLYFFGDRSAFNGTAKIGFWFLVDDVHPTGTGATPGSPFTGSHQNGDIFAINDFTSGGSAATPLVFVWAGKTSTSPGALTGPIINSSQACSKTNDVTTYVWPAVQIAIAAPDGTNPQLWDFDSKKVGNTNTDENTYYPPLFFEGVIDLGQISGASLCFQSFIMQTTTSAQNTAANVDMVAGSFSGVPNPPIVNGDEKCFGFAATATASCTGSTAQWYNAAGQLVQTGSSLTLPAGTAPGTYTFNVTCKTADGCESAPRAVSIIINATPSVQATVTVEPGITKTNDDLYVMKITTTNTAHLVAVGSGGTPPYTYEWSALDANAAVSFSTDASPTDGSKATFKVLSLVGLNTDYSFRVKITDSKGCVNQDDVTIEINPTAPPCAMTGPAVVCAGATNVEYKYTPTPFPDPDFNYIWSITSNNGSTLVGGSPQTNNTSASVFVNVGATAGSYTVSLKLESKTLGGDGNPLIVVNDPNCPVTTTVELVTCTITKNQNTDCFVNNGSATVTPAGGTAPFSYLWDNGETTQTATALSKGNHSVTVTDFYGCQGTCTIDIPENPCDHIFCTGTTCQNFLTGTQILPQICYNTGNGTITPGVFYYWTSLTAPSASFTISVVQTNTCGVVPFVLGSGNQFNLPDGSCTNAGTVSYSQNATTGTVTVSVSGATAGQTYILGLKYFAKSGATFSSTCTFNFVSKIGGTDVSGSQGFINVVLNCAATCVNAGTTIAQRGQPAAPIAETVKDLQVHAYPNPFNNVINFNFVSPESGQASLEVFDLLGRRLAVVYQGNLDAGNSKSINYKVPNAHMIPMIYRLTVGDRSIRGTLLPHER